MRRHPVIIRWCLSIYLKSPGAYKHIKSMFFLNLPCKNTLLKYINFTNPQCGFNKYIISGLMDAVDFGSIKEYQENVSLIFDEVKIKSGLIFCKSTGRLAGFSKMGDMNDATSGFERSVREEKTSASELSLARYVIVFLVKGIFSSLCYPFGYFPSGAIHKGCLHIKGGRGVRQKWTNTNRGMGGGEVAKCGRLLGKKIIATIFVEFTQIIWQYVCI